MTTDLVRLPELSKVMDSDPLEYRDIISQAILERIVIFTSQTVPLVVGGGEPSNQLTNELDEGLGSSGSSGLGSLSLSFPHQMSLSSSTGGSGTDPSFLGNYFKNGGGGGIFTQW